MTDGRAAHSARLGDLVAATGGAAARAPCGVDAAGIVVSSITSDSRAVTPGALFVCLRGVHSDGHRFAADAVRRGAVAVLAEEDVETGDAVLVRTADTHAALARAAAAFYGRPASALRLVGITGTNGKTTTTYMLQAACEAAGVAAGVLGTTGYRFGTETREAPQTTPDAVEFQRLLAWLRDAGASVVACEVSSHGLEQKRTYGTPFAARCFTNLTRDHLDYHGTLEAYRAAKARFFHRAESGVDDGAVAVINTADPTGESLARETDYRVLTVAGSGADVAAEDVRLRADGTTCTVRHPAGRTPLRLRLPAAHNVQNALVAFGAATALGLDAATVSRGLGALAHVPGRLEPVEAGQPFAVLVDYAHTPDALERALHAVREFTPRPGRVVCVFGCGGDRDRGKRPVMGRIAAELGDLVYVTSDNPRTEDPEEIIREILAGVPTQRPVVSLADRRAAIRRAIAEARRGDTVLIAGKGHEDYQILGTTRIHFDDREEARRALALAGYGSARTTPGSGGAR